MIFSILLYTALFVSAYLVYLKFTILTLRAGIPGMKPQLLLGNIKQMGMFEPGGHLGAGFLKWKKLFGDNFQFFLGHRRITVFTTVNAARTVFGKRAIFVQNIPTRVQFGVLSDGLITLDGEPYKRHLRVVGPIFKLHKVTPYLPVVVKTTDRLIAKWNSRNHEEPFKDVLADLQRVTFDVFGKVAYGHDFNTTSKATADSALTQVREEEDLIWAVKYLVDSLSKHMFGVLPLWLARFKWKVHPKINKARNVIWTHLKKSIREWQLKHPDHASNQSSDLSLSSKPSTSTAATPSTAATSSSPSTSSAAIASGSAACTCSAASNSACSVCSTSSSSSASSEPQDRSKEAQEQEPEDLVEESENNMMSRMLHSLDQPDGLSAREIMDELTLFVFGGYETTATTLSWFMYYMSTNPDAQARLRQEIKQVVGMRSDLTASVLDELRYTDHCLKETFRLSPTVSAVSRTATADCDVDGVKVLAGDCVMVCVSVIHRDPRFWKIDPELFAPHRYDEEDKDHDYYAWAPFGGGQRACVGQQFARLEAKAIIVRIMQHFTVKPAPGNHGGAKQQITIQPSGLNVFLTPDRL